MSRVSRCAALLVLAFAVLSLPAMATNVASFQGNCTSGTLSCTFDAGRPSPGSQCTNGIAEYSWNFGDTSGHYYTAFPTISYTYSSSSGYTVTLTVYCWDGATPTTSHCVTFGFGVPGCISPGGGWQP
jgi:hypothetical protein